MSNEDEPRFSLDQLALVPLEEEALPTATEAVAAKPKIDTRHSRQDRRSGEDRRGEVRFQIARRSGQDRRPTESPWSPGAGH